MDDDEDDEKEDDDDDDERGMLARLWYRFSFAGDRERVRERRGDGGGELPAAMAC